MNDNEMPCTARFGKVSAYDPKRHMARVLFPDKANHTSYWLPVAIPNSLKNKDEVHLNENEHVFCVFLGNGLETGIVLASIYDDTNTPPVGDKDIRQTTFEDGTIVKYDRKNSLLEIDCKGDIKIHAAGKIDVVAAGNVTINGALINLN